MFDRKFSPFSPRTSSLRHKLPSSCPQTSPLLIQWFYWKSGVLLLPVFLFFTLNILLYSSYYSNTPAVVESNLLTFIVFKRMLASTASAQSWFGFKCCKKYTQSIHTLSIKPGMEKQNGKLSLAVRLCKFQTMSALRGLFPRVGTVRGNVAHSLLSP